MNLHGIVAGAIGAVNPFVTATLLKSSGYTTDAAGARTPNTVRAVVSVQVQALTFSDIAQLDGLNIQGVRRAIYASGYIGSLIRVGQRGGDLITFQPGTLVEGDVWLCAHVLETWPDWCKIAITLQNGG